MTLNRWFQQNANRPLGVVALLVVLVWVILFIGFINETTYRQVEGTKQLASLLSLSFSQKNRVLTESLLASSHESLAAQSAIICHKGVAVVSSNANNSDCERSGSWLEPKFSHTIPGEGGYKLVLFVSFFKGHSELWNFLLLSLAFAALCSWTLYKLKYRLQQDILLPLEAGLIDDKPMPIVEFEQLRKKRKVIEESKEREAVLQAVLENKSKVAHNIKSPLRALRLIQQSISDMIPERDSKLLSGVIDSITHILGEQQAGLRRSDELTANGFINSIQEKELILISDFLEETLAQKSAEYARMADVAILLDRSEDLFGVFVHVVRHEFRAILSNLVNNGVEAVGTRNGVVRINAYKRDDSVVIQVSDNGCGIPADSHDKIFENGITFKAGGTGIGLYHARQYLSQWKGTIICSNLPEGGARFEIRLPTVKAPVWFAGEIDLSSKKHILIMDDDILIHKIWSDRLSPLIGERAVKVHFAASTSEFEERFAVIASEISESIILCDYDLSSPKCGLDIVRSYGVSALTTLVTNNFHSIDLITECLDEGIQILPKPYIQSVPITI